jgi:hypothetical protein
LTAERLAALADEAPAPAESAHLTACATCREERDAYVALLAVARDEGAAAYALPDAPADSPSADDEAAWTAIAGTLRAEGLVTRPAGRPAGQPAAAPVRLSPATASRWRVGRGVRPGARLAAGVALALAAGAAGRVSAVRGPWSAAAMTDSGPTQAAAPATPEAARRVLARARQEYLRAAAVLAVSEGGDAGTDAGAPASLPTCRTPSCSRLAWPHWTRCSRASGPRPRPRPRTRP